MRKYFVSLLILFGVWMASFNGAGGCGNSGPAPVPTSRITLTVTGNGIGTVTTDQGGISCTKAGGTCSGFVATGASIKLTAMPDAGFLFNHWRGASCPTGRTCTLTINADTTVEASFTHVLYKSARALDGSDATQPSIIKNIWMTTTDGSNQFHVTPFTNATSDNPSLCPDGNKIAYSSNRNLTDFSDDAPHNTVENIWIENADGSGGDFPVTKMTSAGSDSLFSQWTPGQTKIVYVSRRSTSDIGNPAASPMNSQNLWVSNADGSGGDTPLTNFNNFSINVEWPFALSPDGTKIVFTSKLNLSKNPADIANPADNVWVIGIDGTGFTALTQNTATNVTQVQPQWSPDGHKIIWASRRNVTSVDPAAAASLSFNVWIMDADGSNPSFLTDKDNGVGSFNPVWSPDGSRILFVSQMKPSDPGGSSFNSANLWMMNPDGSGLAPFTALTVPFIGDPEWAPDGNSIFYDSERDFNDLSNDARSPNSTINLFSMDPDGSNPLALTKISTMQGDSLTPLGNGT